MEVKKYNPFDFIKPKPKPKPKVKLEARGFALENKKKLDIIYAKGFVNTNRKYLGVNKSNESNNKS